MIAKENRFHGLGSLRFVFKVGQTVRDKNCALRYHINPRRKTYRLSVVVSRKVHKSAVVRNRIRRRVYEHFRQQNIVISQPYDFVLTVYSDEVAEMPSQELEKTISSLFRRAIEQATKTPQKN